MVHVTARRGVVGLSILLLAGLVASSAAEIPEMISYQGRVTDAAGAPVADGTYDMRFRIYDAASGGALQWDSGTRSVQVEGGVFNVLLGESPQPALDEPFDEDYWLLVTFDGVNQSPRQRFASVGYAYMASGLVPGTLIEGSVTTGTGAAIKAVNEATTGTRYGGRFECDASSGRAVYGLASNATGTTYGGKFDNASASGRGVYGYAYNNSGTTYGGYFQSNSSSGRGVYAQAPLYGVHGAATATSGVNYGGYFETASTSGTGVRGIATATTGSTYGIYGRSYSTGTDSRGVYGRSYATVGVTYGVYGWSNSAQGTGVKGYAPQNGVWGEASAGSGTTNGVYALSHSSMGRALYAENTAGGYAGYFVGDVNITGDLTVTGGSAFPTPAYDSDWVTIAAGATTTLTHGLGGDPEDYVVDLEFQAYDMGINGMALGGDVRGDPVDDVYGFYWQELNASTVQVRKGSAMYPGDEFRVRIWTY